MTPTPGTSSTATHAGEQPRSTSSTRSPTTRSLTPSESQERESYLAGCVSIVEQARRAVGCVDVAISADLVDPGRVNIFERWESQSAVDAFRSSGPDDEQRPAMLTVYVEEHDVAGVWPLFGQGTA